MSEPDIAAVAAVHDPVRRRVYEVVRAYGRVVTRAEAADRAGISTKLAAFHLDKLVEVGLLELAEPVGPRRVGRRPRGYGPVPSAVQVSLPARRHLDLAGIVVDGAVAQRPGESLQESSCRAAVAAGRTFAQAAPLALADADELAAVRERLSAAGYEPYDIGRDAVGVRNCPFHPLAARHPDFVCGVNAAFVSGLVDGLGCSTLEARGIEPEGRCCAEIGRRDA